MGERGSLILLATRLASASTFFQPIPGATRPRVGITINKGIRLNLLEICSTNAKMRRQRRLPKRLGKADAGTRRPQYWLIS